MMIGVTQFAPGRQDTASADIVAGQYSLSVTAPGIVPVVSTFIAKVAVTHGGEPPYAAAQWRVNFSNTVITTAVGVIAPSGGAPAECTSKSVTNAGAGSLVNLGCLSLAGPTISYSGDVWDVEFTCAVAGVSQLVLVGNGVNTFVSDGTTVQPSHTHDSPGEPPTVPAGYVACVPTADISAVKTGPAVVNAGDTYSYTIDAVNLGPDPWTAVVLGDDLPDSVTFVSATLQIDSDGNTVPDAAPAACSPGWFAVFPNPFGASPAFLNNVVACASPASSIVMGGTAQAVITVTMPADQCNNAGPFVNFGFAASADNFGGTEIADPSFLDFPANVDLPAYPNDPTADNNFDVMVTSVSDCPVTLTKSAETAVTQGDPINYVLTATNAGPSAALNVVIVDVFPAGVTVITVPAGCVEAPANTVTCTIASLAATASQSFNIVATADQPGLSCNSASATWTRVGGGSANSGAPFCTNISPPFSQASGIMKDCNTTTAADPLGLELVTNPSTAGVEQQCNLWICVDPSTDNLDNNGDSTVDNEPAGCLGLGEGDLFINETIFVRPDCDSHNDDDELVPDGKPVATADDDNDSVFDEDPRDGIDQDGDGKDGEDPYGVLVPLDLDGDGNFGENTASLYEFELCRPPTPLEILNNLLDKDGGEVGEGLSAFEFQVKFDHKIFDLTIAATAMFGPTVNCSMTIITENDIRFGCVSNAALTGTGVISGVAAQIHVTPEADLIYRIRPTKDNGVVRMLLDENCEVADQLGDIFPITNAGLTPQCEDAALTVRRLEGDVNADCNVNISDAQLTAFRYGSFFGHLSFDQNYDLEPWPTGDFDIDIKDLQFVFGRNNSSCQAPIPNQQNPLAGSGGGQP